MIRLVQLCVFLIMLMDVCDLFGMRVFLCIIFFMRFWITRWQLGKRQGRAIFEKPKVPSLIFFLNFFYIFLNETNVKN